MIESFVVEYDETKTTTSRLIMCFANAEGVINVKKKKPLKIDYSVDYILDNDL